MNFRAGIMVEQVKKKVKRKKKGTGEKKQEEGD